MPKSGVQPRRVVTHSALVRSDRVAGESFLRILPRAWDSAGQNRTERSQGTHRRTLLRYSSRWVELYKVTNPGCMPKDLQSRRRSSAVAETLGILGITITVPFSTTGGASVPLKRSACRSDVHCMLDDFDRLR